MGGAECMTLFHVKPHKPESGNLRREGATPTQAADAYSDFLIRSELPMHVSCRKVDPVSNDRVRFSQTISDIAFPADIPASLAGSRSLIFRLLDPAQVVDASSGIVMALCRSRGSREFVPAGTPAGTNLPANVPNDFPGGSGNLILVLQESLAGDEAYSIPAGSVSRETSAGCAVGAAPSQQIRHISLSCTPDPRVVRHLPP